MADDPHLAYPERKRLRLADYDYTSAGYYFVTLVTEHRACLFGSTVDGEMHLNHAGRMVHDIWQEMPDHYGGVDLDVMVLMPNHLHGIVVLGDFVDGGDGRAVPPAAAGTRKGGRPLPNAWRSPNSLGDSNL